MNTSLWIISSTSFASYIGYIALNGAPIVGAGPWAIPGSEILLLTGFALGACVLVLALVAVVHQHHPALALRTFMIGVVLMLASVPVIYTATQLRMYGFALVADRAEPILMAIHQFQKEVGRLPKSTSELQSRFAASFPKGIPPLEFLDIDQATLICPGNKWILRANVSTGLLNWDKFLYFEAENYDQCQMTESLQRVNRWGYYHE